MALKLQVAAVHPIGKVEEEAQRLQGVARLTMLEQSGGRTCCGCRKEEDRSRPRYTECVKSGGSGGRSRPTPKVEIEAIGDKEAKRGVRR